MAEDKPKDDKAKAPAPPAPKNPEPQHTCGWGSKMTCTACS